jgi:hypothetical protein
VKADTLTALGTITLAVLALGTLLVVILQTRLNRSAVDAAVAANAEARRERIDARAPRVVVHEAPEPVWPAALAQSVVTPSRNALTVNQAFDPVTHAQHQLVLTGYVLLHNEGVSSAFIDLPAGGFPVGKLSDRPPAEGGDIVRWSQGLRFPLRLGPGESQWVLLEAGHSVERWMELWHQFEGAIDSPHPSDSAHAAVPGVRFRFDIRDQFTDSFHDVLLVDLLGLPIKPQDGASTWVAQGISQTPFREVCRSRVIGLSRTYS